MDNKYKCPICARVLYSTQGVKKHFETHNDDKIEPHACIKTITESKSPYTQKEVIAAWSYNPKPRTSNKKYRRKARKIMEEGYETTQTTQT